MRHLSLWSPVAVYMAAIFYVSSLSDVSLPGGVSVLRRGKKTLAGVFVG